MRLEVRHDPADTLDRQRQALDIWERTKHAAGTLVERYLASRGLTCAIPASLRYAIDMYHAPSNSYWPAMVAAVTVWPSTTPVAIQRTWLARDGSAKAPIDPAKMSLGPLAGGAVRLADVGSTLVVAEGIETALSVQQASGIPAWATLGSSGFRNLILPDPPVAQEVVIAADADETGVVAARAAARQWVSAGRRVRIAIPPGGANDFNDALYGVAP